MYKKTEFLNNVNVATKMFVVMWSLNKNSVFAVGKCLVLRLLNQWTIVDCTLMRQTWF